MYLTVSASNVDKQPMHCDAQLACTGEIFGENVRRYFPGRDVRCGNVAAGVWVSKNCPGAMFGVESFPEAMFGKNCLQGSNVWEDFPGGMLRENVQGVMFVDPWLNSHTQRDNF